MINHLDARTDILKQAATIVAQLPDQWTPNDSNTVFTRADGATLFVSPRVPGKVEFEAAGPSWESPVGLVALPQFSRTVSLSREQGALVRDLERYVVAPYLSALPELKEKFESQKAATAATFDGINRLNEAAGRDTVPMPIVQPGADPEALVSGPGGQGKFKAGRGGSYQFEGKANSLEVALQIAKLLRGE